MEDKKHTHHFIDKGWEWKELTVGEQGSLEHLVKESPELEVWVKNAENINTNYLRVISFDTGGRQRLIGSLNYSNKPEDPKQNKLMHYFVTKDSLMTIDLNLELFSKLTKKELMERFEQCEDALEAFLILLGEMLNTFLDGIDDFEEMLIKLERDVHFNNKSNLLESIIERRSTMLFLKHHVIPIEEILLGMQEAFLDIEEKTIFKKTAKRLERTMTLLNHYENQIETLLDMNMNLFSFRGNEVIKALTVFTVLVTPITALGALWGMNFKSIPEFEWEHGYLFGWIMILTFTAITYFWLRKKGWTGDILSRKKFKK